MSSLSFGYSVQLLLGHYDCVPCDICSPDFKKKQTNVGYWSDVTKLKQYCLIIKADQTNSKHIIKIMDILNDFVESYMNSTRNKNTTQKQSYYEFNNHEQK